MPKAPNPMRVSEFDAFDYQISQRTQIGGQDPLNRTITQQTQATLSASYHRSLWAGVPLNLTTDPKSQNYEYVKVQDSASSEIDIGYRDGLLARAQARRTASQSTQVMRYELARLVSDVTTPLSGASNIDLTPLLQTLLRNDAAHSGTSATNAPDDDANATQSEIRKRTRLEIDPSRLNV